MIRFAFAALCAVFAATGAARASTVDIMFLLDGSGSLGQNAWDQQIDFVELAIEDYIQPGEGNNRVAVTVFATDVFEIFGFDSPEATSVPLSLAALGALSYPQGFTNTAGAIDAALDEFNANSPTSSQRVVFLITDGNPYLPQGQDVDVCARANNVFSQGIDVRIIGVGNNINYDRVDCLVNSVDDGIYDLGSLSEANVDELFGEFTPAVVPLPAGLPLLLGAIGGLAFLRRRMAA